LLDFDIKKLAGNKYQKL